MKVPILLHILKSCFSNIQGGGRKFQRHFIRCAAILGQMYHQNHQKLGHNRHMTRINPKFATKSEFYHMYAHQCAYAPFRHLI